MNYGLKHLDVSWNCIRFKGAVGMAQGLKVSNCLSCGITFYSHTPTPIRGVITIIQGIQGWIQDFIHLEDVRKILVYS